MPINSYYFICLAVKEVSLNLDKFGSEIDKDAAW